MNLGRLASLALISSCLFAATGCDGDKSDSPSGGATVPPPPSSSSTESSSAGGGKAAKGAAPAIVPELDAATLAKQAKEEDAKLQARIKAGEVGTTPDPVMDQVKEALDAAYQSYFNAYQRAPGSMQDLVRAGYLRAVPPLPAGKKYQIDPNGGGISVVSGP